METALILFSILCFNQAGSATPLSNWYSANVSHDKYCFDEMFRCEKECIDTMLVPSAPTLKSKSLGLCEALALARLLSGVGVREECVINALWGSCNGEMALGIVHFKDHFKQKCHFHLSAQNILLARVF